MNENDLVTIREAAEYSRVTPAALYSAIKLNRLEACKDGKKWKVTKKQLDIYRVNKFNRDNMIHEGERVFDLDKGHLSINHVAKVLSTALGRPYQRQRLYYLIRRGELRAIRKRGAWVIEKQAASDLLDKESNYSIQSDTLFPSSAM